MTEEINVTFIIPKDCRSDNDCSEDMQLAFVVSKPLITLVIVLNLCLICFPKHLSMYVYYIGEQKILAFISCRNRHLDVAVIDVMFVH